MSYIYSWWIIWSPDIFISKLPSIPLQSAYLSPLPPHRDAAIDPQKASPTARCDRGRHGGSTGGFQWFLQPLPRSRSGNLHLNSPRFRWSKVHGVHQKWRKKTLVLSQGIYMRCQICFSTVRFWGNKKNMNHNHKSNFKKEISEPSGWIFPS